MDDLARLRLLQLHDTAFPSGRFVHSHGVESWLNAAPSATTGQIAELAAAYLTRSVATLDAVVLAHAWSATDLPDHLAIDQLLTTFKLSGAARTASESSGRQLALIGTRVFPQCAASEFVRLVAAGATPGNDAVVEGVLTRALGIDRRGATLGYLRSRYTGLLSVAVRLGRAGPIWAQQQVFHMTGLLVELADQALAADLADLESCTPELDIYAMRHETASARLFTT